MTRLKTMKDQLFCIGREIVIERGGAGPSSFQAPAAGGPAEMICMAANRWERSWWTSDPRLPSPAIVCVLSSALDATFGIARLAWVVADIYVPT